MISYIKNLFYFYFVPSKERTTPFSLRYKTSSVFVFLLVQYIFAGVIIYFRQYLVLKNILSPLQYTKGMSVIVNSLFISVLLAPLVEEVVFRLWIIYNKINVSISAAYVLLWLTGMIFQIHWFRTFTFKILYVLLFILIFSALFLLLKKYENQKIKIFWEKNQKMFIIISCILFGAIHIGNFTSSIHSILYYFTTFTPYIFFGFILCYMRIRMGFWTSFSTHILNNFILLILIKII